MPRRPALARKALVADARNRALRTAMQSSAVLAVVMLITAAVSWLNGSAFNWRLTLGSVATACLLPLASLLQRLYVDTSSLPSPLPPSDDVEVTARRRRPRKTSR